MRSNLEWCMIRYKMIDKHIELVRNGEFEIARYILLLLKNGSVRLGLGDREFKAEIVIEELGLRPAYGRGCNSVKFYLKSLSTKQEENKK